MIEEAKRQHQLKIEQNERKEDECNTRLDYEGEENTIDVEEEEDTSRVEHTSQSDYEMNEASVDSPDPSDSDLFDSDAQNCVAEESFTPSLWNRVSEAKREVESQVVFMKTREDKQESDLDALD